MAKNNSELVYQIEDMIKKYNKKPEKKVKKKDIVELLQKSEILMAMRTSFDDADIYNEYYGKSNMIICGGYDEENKFVAAGELSGYDDMLLTVRGNDDRIIVTAVYDNLGKGASGAALQCMNIMLGIDETEGLNLSPRAAV